MCCINSVPPEIICTIDALINEPYLQMTSKRYFGILKPVWTDKKRRRDMDERMYKVQVSRLSRVYDTVMKENVPDTDKLSFDVYQTLLVISNMRHVSANAMRDTIKPIITSWIDDVQIPKKTRLLKRAFECVFTDLSL